MPLQLGIANVSAAVNVDRSGGRGDRLGLRFGRAHGRREDAAGVGRAGRGREGVRLSRRRQADRTAGDRISVRVLQRDRQRRRRDAVGRDGGRAGHERRRSPGRGEPATNTTVALAVAPAAVAVTIFVSARVDASAPDVVSAGVGRSRWLHQNVGAAGRRQRHGLTLHRIAQRVLHGRGQRGGLMCRRPAGWPGWQPGPTTPPRARRAGTSRPR